MLKDRRLENFIAISIIVLALAFALKVRYDIRNPSPRNLRPVQTIEIDDDSRFYILFDDGPCGGFGDPGWVVFEGVGLPKETGYVLSCIGTNTTSSDIGSVYDGLRLILSNYSEDGSHTENPNIQWIDDYIVFERGGLYYGLYDMGRSETLVNDWSSWAPDRDMDKWVKENLHDEIVRLMDLGYDPSALGLSSPKRFSFIDTLLSGWRNSRFVTAVRIIFPIL